VGSKRIYVRLCKDDKSYIATIYSERRRREKEEGGRVKEEGGRVKEEVGRVKEEGGRV